MLFEKEKKRGGEGGITVTSALYDGHGDKPSPSPLPYYCSPVSPLLLQSIIPLRFPHPLHPPILLF